MSIEMVLVAIVCLVLLGIIIIGSVTLLLIGYIKASNNDNISNCEFYQRGIKYRKGFNWIESYEYFGTSYGDCRLIRGVMFYADYVFVTSLIHRTVLWKPVKESNMDVLFGTLLKNK